MLPNEIFALACRAYYDEQGLIVDKHNGQFAHSPLTRKECDTGYYLLWEHHQQQGLLQSKDLDKCCFFGGDAKKWLKTCNPFPDNYFELWDIYEKYVTAPITPEVVAKRVRTRKERGYNTTHLQNEDVRNRARESMLKFWNSSQGEVKRAEIKGKRAPRARTVEVQFANGRIGVYPTVRLASIALGVDPYTISRWIKGWNLPQGANKGIKVREIS